MAAKIIKYVARIKRLGVTHAAVILMKLIMLYGALDDMSSVGGPNIL